MFKPFVLLAMLLGISSVQAHDEGFHGDFGGMVSASSATVSGASARLSGLPYIYGDWGHFYGRVDTFGMRLLPMGHGHLEVAARVSTEGFEGRRTAYPALADRRSPLPLGLGTFQRTPLGGVFAYLMHDTASGGQFAELTWAARLSMGPVAVYPQLGLQYRSAAYVNHLYGVTAAESAATGLSPYRAGASVAPHLALHMAVPLGGPWSLQAQARRRWFDGAIHGSPLVDARSQTSGLLALTRSFD